MPFPSPRRRSERAPRPPARPLPPRRGLRVSRAGLALRLLALSLVFAVILPPHLVALRFGWRSVRWAPLVFHRAFLWLFGVRVVERGTPPQAGVATLVL